MFRKNPQKYKKNAKDFIAGTNSLGATKKEFNSVVKTEALDFVWNIMRNLLAADCILL